MHCTFTISTSIISCQAKSLEIYHLFDNCLYIFNNNNNNNKKKQVYDWYRQDVQLHHVNPPDVNCMEKFHYRIVHQAHSGIYLVQSVIACHSVMEKFSFFACIQNNQMNQNGSMIYKLTVLVQCTLNNVMMVMVVCWTHKHAHTHTHAQSFLFCTINHFNLFQFTWDKIINQA